MPRKFFKRISPDPKKIKENRFLSIFGDWLHEPQLWHLNRYSASVAIAIGLFCAFIPVPFQMVIAAALAIGLRANLPLSVATCWVTNPLTIPPMFYFAYTVGAWTLGTPESPFEFELSMEWLQNELVLIWKPFLLGCLICAIVASILGYFTIQMAWRYHVVMAWRARKERWKEKIKETLHIGEHNHSDLIAVLPKNYRALAIEAIKIAENPVVLFDKEQIFDFSESGHLTQAEIRKAIDFEIKDDKTSILGFHDHPNEMWINQNYKSFAIDCENKGWLKIQN